MPHDPSEVRVFVAMPGTTMGEKASWSNIQEVKRRLLQPVVHRLEERLKRPATLIIEKDKTSTGVIHRSMFAEALDADVYIADLSGANANVYLELGVRWALRDGVTIPICQNLDEVKFNVSSTRVIRYGPMPDELEGAVGQIVEAAVEGLLHPSNIDSPVRDGLALVTVSRLELEGLREEIDRLRQQQAEDLIRAALATSSPERTDLLRQAIVRNPASVEAHFQLGVALRMEGALGEAAQELEKAVLLKDDFSVGWRELGVVFSKGGELDRAVEAFDRATSLDEHDAETWSTFGGLLRRMARGADRGTFNWDVLRQAKNAYARATALSGNDSYPKMNEARISLLLSVPRPEDRLAALGEFKKLEHLTRWSVEDTDSADSWKLFDLADVLLLTGRADEALGILRKGIELIPKSKRGVVLSSVIEPLQDFVDIPGLLDSSVAVGVRRAITEYVNASMDE